MSTQRPVGKGLEQLDSESPIAENNPNVYQLDPG